MNAITRKKRSRTHSQVLLILLAVLIFNNEALHDFGSGLAAGYYNATN